jgi:peroxiredoxin Q/BCP
MTTSRRSTGGRTAARKNTANRARGRAAATTRTAPVPARGTAGGQPGRTRRGWVLPVAALAVVGLVIAGLYAVYRHGSDNGRGSAGNPSGIPYAVGAPGPGQPAIDFTLASTTSGQTNLAGLRGNTVLLYFQEGLTCQPCWDQIADLERHSPALKQAGIDRVISITSDPVDLLARKARDMRLSTPVLSDPDLAVSTRYHANGYGMMGTSRDGHSFILVGPDGTIQWRADYGGAPKYTMFIPTDKILADLRAGQKR